jgi:ribonuclease H2 subunit A
VVESKADFKYPIVGAASIAAKVTRDACLSYWTFLEGSHATTEDRNFGSGYPSDPRTVAWLENNLDPVFGYTNIARFSWATVRSLMDKKGGLSFWLRAR